EQEVVKCVLLRESYLERIKSVMKGNGRMLTKRKRLHDQLEGLLDMLRVATVETVEAIQAWRHAQEHSAPFFWKATNYLLKIPSDLDLIDCSEDIRLWLGFNLTRNPFIVPTPLVHHPVGNPMIAGSVLPMDIEGFTVVGGRRTQLTQNKSGNSSARQIHQNLLGNPLGGGGVIGDMDMLRVREAEKVILQEEEIHGRYEQDSSSRLIPAASALCSSFSKALLLDDHRELLSPAQVPVPLAPFAHIAGVGCITQNQHMAQTLLVPPTVKRGVGVRHASGTASSQRSGGRLYPSSMVKMESRRRRPLKRSLGAALDAEMTRRRQKNTQLQQELHQMHCSLQNARKCLAHAENMVQQDVAPLNETIEDENMNNIFTDVDDLTPAIGCLSKEFSNKKMELGRDIIMLQQKEEELEYDSKRLKAMQEQLDVFKELERNKQDRRRGLTLERKRRLLEQDLDIQKRACDVSKYTIEDVAATQLQRIVRGVQRRAFVKLLRPIYDRAATSIQRIVRGHLGRSMAKVKQYNLNAATKIQMVIRGHIGRAVFRRELHKSKMNRAAQIIQCEARRRTSQQRAANKRCLLESARHGAEVVSVRQLFHQDIVELANAIKAPLLDGTINPPPSIVLGLIKVVELMLIGSGSAHDIISHYNTIGVKYEFEMRPENRFGWRNALRLLQRTSKFFRRLRQLAEGPQSSRPRMLHLSKEAVQTYNALKHNQGWGVAAMGQVGAGAKACQQLTLWVDSLQEVFAYQLQFTEDLQENYPVWLERVQASRRCMRHLEVQHAVWKRSCEIADQILHETKNGITDHPGTNHGRKGDLRVVVAERGVTSLRIQEAAIQEAITELRRSEEKAQQVDMGKEQFHMHTVMEELKQAEKNVADAKHHFTTTRVRAQDGDKSEQGKLPVLLEVMTNCEIIRRECWTKVELARIQGERNMKRRGVDLIISGDVRLKAQALGELEAALTLAEEDLRYFYDMRKMVPGSTDLTEMSSSDVAVIQGLKEKEKDTRTQATMARAALEAMEAEIEMTFTSAEKAEMQSKTRIPQEWDNPTLEEYEEDVREDEKCAQEELEMKQQYVPQSILTRPFGRPRPFVICISRDVPAIAKKNMVERLVKDLPGLTMHLDEETSFGLHLNNIQKALSARYCVVCNVDVGIGQGSRRSFLQHAIVTREALIPVPNLILVKGENTNRLGEPHELHLGCDETDLNVMRDGQMKRCLQSAAQAVMDFQQPDLVDMMEKLGQLEKPPSPACHIIMEATIILLTSHKTLNITPFSALSGVSWMEARQLLQHTQHFQAAILAVDIYSIPPLNLSSLQAYITHKEWPPRGCIAASSNKVLAHLCEWVSAVVTFATLLRKVGGNAPAVTRRSPVEGLFHSVVQVQDGNSSGNELDADSKRGWLAAYYSLLSSVLEDVRTFRIAKHIKGANEASSTVHMVEVYQECKRLFFSVYNPETCVRHILSLDESKVSHLLAPRLNECSEFGPKTVPKDHETVMVRLIELLHFQELRQRQGGGKKLVCQRTLQRLLRETRHISGHLAVVTVYEEARGEIRCHVYLASYSARLEYNVDAAAIKSVLPDSSISTGERDALESEDASKLLTPITDRLAISPALSTIIDMGVRPKGLMGRVTKSCSQGFLLKIRRKGGPGRLLFRKVYQISGALHVVTVLELGRGGMLRVLVYNNITSIECEVSISSTERICLGYGNDSWKSWNSDMIRRLSLRKPVLSSYFEGRKKADTGKGPLRHSDRALLFDRTILFTTLRVPKGQLASKVMFVRALLVDAGEALAIELYQVEVSSQCRILLSAAQLVKIIGNSNVTLIPPTDCLEPSTANSMVTTTQCAKSEDSPKLGNTTMALILAGKKQREHILQCIKSNLHYSSEEECVSLTVGDFSVRAIMAVPVNLDERRPQRSVCSTFSGNTDPSNSQAREPIGFREQVVSKKRQPDITRYSYMYGEDESGIEHYPRPQDAEKERAAQLRREAAKTKKKLKHENKKLKGSGEKKKKNNLSRHKERNITAKKDNPSKIENQLSVQGDLDLLESPNAADNTEEKDPIASKNIVESSPLDTEAETCTFKEAIKVRVGGWEQHQPACDVIVTVFESWLSQGITPASTDGIEGDKLFRVVVYNPKLASCAETFIEGKNDLCEVAGPLKQELVTGNTTLDPLFHFIFHERMKIMEGTWDEELDCYVAQDTKFTVVLKRSRLYRSIKQTPIHLGGDKDAEANKAHIIKDKEQRGRKVFRRALRINGALFQVTAYDLVGNRDTDGAVPTMKFIAYESKKQTQLVTLVKPEAVLEICGGVHSPWLVQEKRTELAGIVAESLRIKFSHGGEPTLVVSWSGEKLGYADETYRGEQIRPPEERTLSRSRSEDFERLAAFSTRITDLEVVVTVIVEAREKANMEEAIAKGDDDINFPTLIFNIYCPKLAASTDVDLPYPMQRNMTGQSILQYSDGEARSSALHRVVRYLCLSDDTEIDPMLEGRRRLKANVHYKEQKTWLAAYNNLDTSDEPSLQKTIGQPLVFIPSDLEGDLVLCKGVTISGLKILLSIYTKSKGLAGNKGLVWEAYSQETCLTSFLHTGASELLEQVDQKEHLLEDSHLVGTIHMLLARLVLEKGTTGTWQLRLDHRLKPCIFGGL
ncbi:unnamed protein product, partial [Choristocarpus tenellus]